MTKQDLISAIAQKTSQTKKDVGAIVDAFIEVVTEVLSGKTGAKVEDRVVSLTGFGKFGISQRPARKGINPRTKAPIDIKAMKLPVFRAGKTLKDSVR